MVGVIQRILGGVKHLAHQLARRVLLGNLPAGPVWVRLGGQRRPGQLQLKIVKSRQPQLPAEQRHRGHRHLALRAQIGNADILRLLLMLQHIVGNLSL